MTLDASRAACSYVSVALLDGAGEETPDEVALEGEEDGERTSSETKVAGAMMSMFEPNLRSCGKIATVIGWVRRWRDEDSLVRQPPRAKHTAGFSIFREAP